MPLCRLVRPFITFFQLFIKFQVSSPFQVMKPFYVISPFYQVISPFDQIIAAFHQVISPFYQVLSPFYQAISPFYQVMSRGGWQTTKIGVRTDFLKVSIHFRPKKFKSSSFSIYSNHHNNPHSNSQTSHILYNNTIVRGGFSNRTEPSFYMDFCLPIKETMQINF